jgi:hypothetical protein
MSSDTPGLILYDSVAVFLCFVAICQCFPKTAKCSVTRIARNILYVGLLEMLFFLEEIKIQVFRLARSVALFFWGVVIMFRSNSSDVWLSVTFVNGSLKQLTAVSLELPEIFSLRVFQKWYFP